jgi:hypothetical protein
MSTLFFRMYLRFIHNGCIRFPPPGFIQIVISVALILRDDVFSKTLRRWVPDWSLVVSFDQLHHNQLVVAIYGQLSRSVFRTSLPSVIFDNRKVWIG